MSKRYLVLLHDAYGGHGGIARFNSNLLSALSLDPAVESITVLRRHAPKHEEEAVPEKVRFVSQAEQGGAAFLLAALKQGIFGPSCDAVISGHLNLLPAALLARGSAPLALILHGIDAWQPTGRFLVDRFLGRCKRVFAVSQVTLDRFAGWSGYPKDRCRLLPNTIDLQAFTPGPRRDDLEARFGLKGKKVILTLARLAGRDRHKGIDEMFEVLKRLAPDQPDLVYLVAGTGPDRDRLEAKARDLGIAAQVVFTGYVAEEEKADLYRLADAFVLCGRGEGFGIVLLEAMASGLPVLASSLDGSIEAVQGGKLGLLADPDDLDQLTAAVRDLLARPAGQRPDGLEDFSLGAFNQQVLALMDEISGR
ncbi:glycosyltransferase family 4 protein [Rhodovibrionaceae bacterium A322]